MAIGFPVKANYAAGDILTSTQMNDLSGTLNYLDPTAKGDLFPASSGTALTRLAVGNNGETLVADSSTSTGLRYQSNFAAGKNEVINGDFGIWQRGTSFTTGTGYQYTVDRFQQFNYGTNTASCTQQTFTAGAAPVAGYEGQYFARFNSSSTATFFSYRIEDVRTLAGQTATFSFWAKSNSSQTITSTVSQNFGSGGSATVANVISGSPALTTSWQRFSYTAAIPSISGKTIGTSSYVLIEWVGAANNAVDIWGVQLEAGSVATAFQTATGTIQGELAACQRYFIRTAAAANFGNIGVGQLTAATTGVYTVTFPTEMRVTPSVTASAANTFVMTNGADSSSAVTTAPSLNVGGKQTVCLSATASGLASGGSGQGSRLLINNAASGYVDFSGEL